jgi:GT2 family glycosyltransferase
LSSARLSVIVPTRNKLPRLRLMLGALGRAAPPTGGSELIIVDDGSTDGTGEWLAGYGEAWVGALPLRIVREHGAGRSSARKRGAQESEGELLLFLDDDVLVTAEHLQVLAGAHEGRRDVVARGPILELPWLRHLDDPAAPSQATGLIASLALDAEALRTGGPGPFAAQPRPSWLERAVQEHAARGALPYWACAGANLSVHRATFEAAGGFDPALGRTWGLEDLELGLRLEALGVVFRQLDQAVVYHMSHHRPGAFAEHTLALDYVLRKHGQAAAALAALFERRGASP